VDVLNESRNVNLNLPTDDICGYQDIENNFYSKKRKIN